MAETRYAIDGETCRFSHGALDALVRGRRAGPHATMRDMASSLNVSLTSIKEWRRGAHAPSDISKVEDLAAYFRAPVAALLKKEENPAMTKLNDIQLMAFYRVHKKISEFFWMVENTDHLVWHEYDLLGYPRSIVADLVPTYRWPPTETSPSKLTYGEHGIRAQDLHQQLWEGTCRALEAEKPLLLSCGLYDELDEYIEKYVYGYGYGDEEGGWIPGPDGLFEPNPPSHMEIVEAEAATAMGEIIERYGMAG